MKTAKAKGKFFYIIVKEHPTLYVKTNDVLFELTDKKNASLFTSDDAIFFLDSFSLTYNYKKDKLTAPIVLITVEKT